MPRFMMIVKANDRSEQGLMPAPEVFEEMGKYNEELVNAGILLAGDGLHPSSKGARVHFSGKNRTVVDGPFAETKELIAGFWIIQAKSLEEAVELARRIPNPTGEEGVVEVRQIFDAADFEGIAPPEVMEQEEQLRQRIEEQQKNKG